MIINYTNQVYVQLWDFRELQDLVSADLHTKGLRMFYFLIHRKYDHYCSWVHAAIGERTMRWYILFLISCLYMTVCGFIGFSLRFKDFILTDKHLSGTLLDNFKYYFKLFCQIPDLTFATIITAFGALKSLWCLLVHISQISQNITSIEAGKYQKLTKQRKQIGIKDPPNNMYDKGLCYNWMEVLFPV